MIYKNILIFVSKNSIVVILRLFSMLSPLLINDPVHGFITVPADLLPQVLHHRFVQRLRYIRQLGLTHLVYPTATHTRFAHSVGAMHLMTKALNILFQKGIDITPEEAQAAQCAILMHDIGHSPFSHALECQLFTGVVHEDISLAMMKQMNMELGGKLSLAIEIFTNKYSKKYLYQLISSQLDMDRMDYLARDSFFAGVAEGAVGVERIIQMLNVVDNELVIDAKGIHSVEQFLIARRQMYWQVYLHKTVTAAEQLLISTVRRMQYLLRNNTILPVTEPLLLFLKNEYSSVDLNAAMLNLFALVSDGSVDAAIAACTQSDDAILRRQCIALTERTLPAIEISDVPFTQHEVDAAAARTIEALGIDSADAQYFVNQGTLCSRAYSLAGDAIKIRTRRGDVCGIHLASDMLDASAFLHDRVKYFLCWGLQDERQR